MKPCTARIIGECYQAAEERSTRGQLPGAFKGGTMNKLMLVLVAVVLAGCVVKKKDVDRHTWPFQIQGETIAWGEGLNAGDTLIYGMKKDTTGEILEAEFVRFSPRKMVVLLAPVQRGLVYWPERGPTQEWVRGNDIWVLDVLPILPQKDTCKYYIYNYSTGKIEMDER
jgi:hypothetical protein